MGASAGPWWRSGLTPASWAEFSENLAYMPATSAESRQGLVPDEQFAVFDGYKWTRLTAENWKVPQVAVVSYFAAILAVKLIMRNREPIRVVSFARFWNFFLSAFSLGGVATCVPLLLFGSGTGVLTGGFQSSVCVHPELYGTGWSGLFVCLFIYSKVFELADTFILLLRKKELEFLHYWHHSTVLLYCWHSYTTRIGTGLWFAAMNYSVHSIMYFYFGMTECGSKGRALVRPFAMFVTSIQLCQMVMGIAVTVSAAYFSSSAGGGHDCSVNPTNSFLGLSMYLSYFLLFGELFLRYYGSKGLKKNNKAQAKREQGGKKTE